MSNSFSSSLIQFSGHRADTGLAQASDRGVQQRNRAADLLRLSRAQSPVEGMLVAGIVDRWEPNLGR
jgi:hypothetical protein